MYRKQMRNCRRSRLPAGSWYSLSCRFMVWLHLNRPRVYRLIQERWPMWGVGRCPRFNLVRANFGSSCLYALHFPQWHWRDSPGFDRSHTDRARLILDKHPDDL